MKFNKIQQKKHFSAYLQIEVLIAISLLSISVIACSLGVSSYRKQCQRLLIQRHLSLCVHDAAEHIDRTYPQWKTSQSYSNANLSPLDFISLDEYSSQLTLYELSYTCTLEVPSFFQDREAFFISGIKEVSFGSVIFEQVFFYCYIKIDDYWVYSCAMKSYVLN